MAALGYAGVFVINLIASGSFILPVPGLAATFVAARFYNPLIVALAAATGAALGEMTGYLAGMGISPVVRRVRWWDHVEGWMLRHGFLTVFIAAALPNPLFDFIGLVAGNARYPALRFFGACWLGKTLKFLVVAGAGA